jgi:alginate O-acetyltransferase complex protein AlgI
LVVIGWDIFYFTDVHRMGESMALLLGLSGQPLYDFEVLAAISAHAYWLALALIMTTPLVLQTFRKICHSREAAQAQWLELAANVFLLSVSVTLLVGKTYNPFIYFRF